MKTSVAETVVGTVVELVETTVEKGFSTKTVVEPVETTRIKGISTSSMPATTVVETCPERSRRAVETTRLNGISTSSMPTGKVVEPVETTYEKFIKNMQNLILIRQKEK